MKFVFMNENRKFKEGNILLTFKINNNNKEYALYSSDDFDDNICELEVAVIEKNNRGFDILLPVIDEEREQINNLFKEWRESNGKTL